MPEPPYVAVIFTNRRTGVDDAGYAAMAAEMEGQASAQPGYIGIESARGADGVGITVSYWATEDDASAWKLVADHLGAQRLGQQRWYAEYITRIAVVGRQYRWRRTDT